MSEPGSQPPAEPSSAPSSPERPPGATSEGPPPPPKPTPPPAASPAPGEEGGTLDFLPAEEGREVDIELVRRRLWLAGAVWSTAFLMVSLVLLQETLADPAGRGWGPWLAAALPASALLLLWLGRPSRWGRYWLQQPRHTLYLGHGAWPSPAFWAAAVLGLLALAHLGWGATQAWQVSLQHAIPPSHVFREIAWPIARSTAPLLLAMFAIRMTGERAERAPLQWLLLGATLAMLLPGLSQLGDVWTAWRRELPGEGSVGRLVYSLVVEVAPLVLLGVMLAGLTVLVVRGSGWRVPLLAGPVAIAGVAILVLLAVMWGGTARPLEFVLILSLTFMQAAALIPLIGLHSRTPPLPAPGD